MMPQEQLKPDTDEIRRDLEYMVSRWGELDEPAVFEVRAFAPDTRPVSLKYAPDWIDDAVEAIVNMNSLGKNVYVVRNPIRHDVSGSATDDDIIASFFLWADCDSGAATDNVRRFDGPKFSASVKTGTVPETRVHIYWQLKEPCTDMAEWRNMQTRIAAHFDSDRSVINPSRIMRVSGTITYPDTKKQARGYISERTTLRTEYDDPREPVTLDQMGRVFVNQGTSNTPHGNNFQIDTGEHETLDRALAAANIAAGANWRNNLKSLVASYVARGWTDNEIIARCAAFTLEGYTVDETAEDVAAFITWTREQESKNGGKYAASPDQASSVEGAPQLITDFKIDSSEEFLADLEPLEYLIDGLLPIGVTYSLTGYAGHGKTTLALQFALSVAMGEDFAMRPTNQGDVLILAGENPYNVKWQYAAALAARGVTAKDVPIHFVQGRFSIKQMGAVLREKMNAMPNLKLVIVDSLQAFFEGDNDNDNTQMVEMAHSVRAIVETKTKPALVVIAHPAGKAPSKDSLVPRGGGAFLNEIDGNLTVWSQDSSQQTLHHSQKFRGAGFDPIEFIMQVHEFDHLHDVDGVPLKLPVSRPEMLVERTSREKQSEDLLARYLYTVDAEMPLSVREMASQFCITRYRAETIIQTAKDEKLIKRYAKTFILTGGGKAFLEDRNA